MLCLAYEPEGRWMAIGTGEPIDPKPGDDCEVLVKDTIRRTGTQASGWARGTVRSLSVSPDGRLVAIGTAPGKVRASLERRRSGRTDPLGMGGPIGSVARSPFGEGEVVRQVDFSPDGKTLRRELRAERRMIHLDPGGVRFFDEDGRATPRSWPGRATEA